MSVTPNRLLPKTPSVHVLSEAVLVLEETEYVYEYEFEYAQRRVRSA